MKCKRRVVLGTLLMAGLTATGLWAQTPGRGPAGRTAPNRANRSAADTPAQEKDSAPTGDAGNAAPGTATEASDPAALAALPQLFFAACTFSKKKQETA